MYSEGKTYISTLENTFRRTETMNYLRHFTEHSNFAANEHSLSIYLSMPRTTENQSREVILDFRGIYLKLLRLTSVMMMQTNVFYILYFEQQNWKQKVLKNFRLNIDVLIFQKEKEDSWLNATKTKILSFKGLLNFSSKSATTANVYLMESHLH